MSGIAVSLTERSSDDSSVTPPFISQTGASIANTDCDISTAMKKRIIALAMDFLFNTSLQNSYGPSDLNEILFSIGCFTPARIAKRRSLPHIGKAMPEVKADVTIKTINIKLSSILSTRRNERLADAKFIASLGTMTSLFSAPQITTSKTNITFKMTNCP